METKTNLEDLRCPLSDARKCLTILLANAQEALADIPVTEERPTESELPGNKLLGWVNAGEVIFRTLTYLNHLEHGINDTDRYIDELLAKASPKPAPASSSQKQPEQCSTQVSSGETGPTPAESSQNRVDHKPAEKQPEVPPKSPKMDQTGSTHESSLDDVKVHLRGLIGCLMGKEFEKEKILDALQDVFSECKHWGLLSALEKRALNHVGAYPVEGNWLIDMRDHSEELMQFLPSVTGGDGETDRWVQDAAVKLFAVIRHALPDELTRCTVEEWMKRDRSDFDTSDNDAGEQRENGKKAGAV